MDPAQLALYNQLYNQYNPASSSQTAPSAIDLTAGGPTAGLQQFFNSPIYSLLYGTNLANQNQANLMNGTYNPVTSFFNDPSYQFALSEGSRNIANNFAAKGLTDSGAFSKALSDYGQGTASQYYGNYLSTQNSLFNNYQNQLSGLAQLGAQTNGANQANANGNLLAQLLSGANLSTGQNLANAALNVGENAGTLYGNQGVLGAGAYLNTGAAMSNNLFQGASLASQISNANAATQAGNQSGANNLGILSGARGGSTGGSYSGGMF